MLTDLSTKFNQNHFINTKHNLNTDNTFQKTVSISFIALVILYY